MGTSGGKIALNRLWRRCLCLLVGTVSLGTALGFGLAGTASAASNGLWSVFPTELPGQPPRAFVQPELTPGKPYTDSVTVANYTAASLTFHLYGADAINTAGGGLSLRRRTDVQTDIGKWITLPYSQLTVPARSAAVVPFTILPPAQASPGDHVGGIVAEETQGTTSKAGSIPITVIQAVGVRVYGRVVGALSPGLDVRRLSLTAATSASTQILGTVDARVSFSVVNSGNTVLSPVAHVVLTTTFGTAATRRIGIDQLLPGSSLHYALKFPGVNTLGHLSAQVTVTSAQARASDTASLWAVPWALLAIIVLALVLLITLFVRFRRRRRARTPTPGMPQPEASSTSPPA
jgi:hypothetical protein